MMHGHDAAVERVAGGACGGGEHAMAAEVEGGGREGSVEGKGDVRRLLEVGGKIKV